MRLCPHARAGHRAPSSPPRTRHHHRTTPTAFANVLLPPWLCRASLCALQRLAHFSSPLMRLHNEIVAFTAMLEPTAEETASRAASLACLREVVAGMWKGAEVQVFGSYATGLYTPASDTDVVVVNSGVADAQRGGGGGAGGLSGCSAGMRVEARGWQGGVNVGGAGVVRTAVTLRVKGMWRQHHMGGRAEGAAKHEG